MRRLLAALLQVIATVAAAVALVSGTVAFLCDYAAFGLREV